jgi:hypothetical protein
MLPGDQIVALIRHETDLGATILHGGVQLPFDSEAIAMIGGTADPETRVQLASHLDTATVCRFLGEPQSRSRPATPCSECAPWQSTSWRWTRC